jgi:hypothetical protein
MLEAIPEVMLEDVLLTVSVGGGFGRRRPEA